MLITFRKEVRSTMNIQSGDCITYHVEGKQVRVQKNKKGYKINTNWQAVVPSHVKAVLAPGDGERIVIDKVLDETAYLTVVSTRRKKLAEAALPEQVSYRRRAKLVDKYVKSLNRFGRIELRESLNTADISHILRHIADLIDERKSEEIQLRLSYEKIQSESVNPKLVNTKPVQTYSVLIELDGVRRMVTHVTTCEIHNVSEEILSEYPGCEIIYLIPQKKG